MYTINYNDKDAVDYQKVWKGRDCQCTAKTEGMILKSWQTAHSSNMQVWVPAIVHCVLAGLSARVNWIPI